MDPLALRRLRLLKEKILEICTISGTPGLSYGVIHENQVLHTENIGYADVQARIPPTSDTRYGIGSLTKAFTAAAVGNLVSDGKIAWETPVHEILGDGFHFSEPSLTQRMSVLDVLSHRMGLQRSNQLWYGNDNALLLDKNQVLSHTQYIKPVQPFNTTVHYSNWGYALAGQMVEKLSSQSWSAYVEKTLFAPLHMDNTNSQDNVDAKPYTVLDDRSFQLLPAVKVRDGTIMDSSQGIRSSVNDMLKWCQALLKGYLNEQKGSQGNFTSLPLRQLSKQMSSLTPFAKPFDSGSSYGMGWVRAQIPTIIGAVGCNPGFVRSMPIVGRGRDEEVIYHQGSLAGYTTSLFLIPKTQSAIVVLTNSIGLNDPADWIGQLILESLLDVKNSNDYVKYAQESADAHLAKFPAMHESLEANRISGTQPKALDTYVGRYYNEIRDFHIEIAKSPQKKGLQLAFQGLDSQTWEMTHYHHDSFVWLMSRNEAVSRARFPYSPEKLYRLDFHTTDNGEVDSLFWEHDADGPPEKFARASSEKSDLNGSSAQFLAL